MRYSIFARNNRSSKIILFHGLREQRLLVFNMQVFAMIKIGRFLVRLRILSINYCIVNSVIGHKRLILITFLLALLVPRLLDQIKQVNFEPLPFDLRC